MNNKGFYIEKNPKTKDTVYIEYTSPSGYKIVPTKTKDDSIEVNKIVIVSPKLSQKIIKKKIEHKLSYFFKLLEEINSTSSGDASGTIKQALIEAEKFRLMIINNYVKYLGNTFTNLTLKKMELLINELRINLYKNYQMNMYKNIIKTNFYVNMELEEKTTKRGR